MYYNTWRRLTPMVHIPQLPEREELEYREKEFFLSLYEQFQASSKFFFYVLIVLILVAVPMKYFLSSVLTRSLISAYHPPPVNTAVYSPKNLEVLQAEILSINPQTFSLVAQVLNPNSEISVHSFEYEFVLKDEQNRVLEKIPGESFILARESKFLFDPLVTNMPTPAKVEFNLGKVRWTIRKPEDIMLEILQKNSGQTLEGNFFVEGLVKNSQGFGLKKIQVSALVFDSRNQNILAVNQTILTELKPFESRYFRMIWPRRYENIGEIQVIPILNLLDPGLSLEKGRSVPAR